MSAHHHIIELSTKEIFHLQSIIRRGKHHARVMVRAKILVCSSRGETKEEVASRLEVGSATVQRIRNRYRDGGLDRALYDAPRPGQPPKITNEGEAYLVALATSHPPDGHPRWTLKLLKERIVQAGKVPKDITTVALWKRLDKRQIKPWREKNVVYTKDHA